jgi:hypothetical protein
VVARHTAEAVALPRSSGPWSLLSFQFAGVRRSASEIDPVAVDEQMAFGAWSGTVRGVRVGRFAPFLAATDTLSMQPRLQSMALALPSQASRTRCSHTHTPAACQSRSLRQQVIPESQPISLGRQASQCRRAARTRCLPAPCGHRPAACHPSATGHAAARSAAKARRGPEDLLSMQPSGPPHCVQPVL